MSNSRTSYPRPQFKREGNWINLNGSWDFCFDDQNIGIKEGWFNTGLRDIKKINVPFVYQAPLSGIDCQEKHDIVWYQREIELTSETKHRSILHFGAVDYFADVYVNGDYIGHHEGGDASFSFDITDTLIPGETQIITVRAEDRTYDETIPRGKQSWTGKSEGIWYTNSTGIWQTVWVESVAQKHIEQVRMTPDLDHTSVKLAIDVADSAIGAKLGYEIKFGETVIANDQLQIQATHIERSVELAQQKIFRTEFHNDGWTWTPEHPNLFDITFSLTDQDIVDQVTSYFGLRKVHAEKGMIMLNNRPYYQKLVLDQGYWPDGLLTAPKDEDYKNDILMAKELGFNGCRKHQKIEDPRFLYWADKLGYLVWEEVASVPYYSEKSANRIVDAWQEAVERDYNHPSIIMWVPLNESWGVDRIHSNQQQQHFSESLYHLLHALDGTRLVQSNDGWEITTTDVVAIHNYSHGRQDDPEQYKFFQNTLSSVETLVNQAPVKWDIFANGFKYEGQPIVLTEFGGIGFDGSREDGWGYTRANSESEYLSELQRVLSAVAHSRGLWGYCYTQLTDVEQEVNGLLTYDRRFKADPEKVKAIFDFQDINRLSGNAADYRQ
ncbi:glycoside hydrolase family 2 protein [Lapidilactobacillus salsurivasis]